MPMTYALLYRQHFRAINVQVIMWFNQWAIISVSGLDETLVN